MMDGLDLGTIQSFRRIPAEKIDKNISDIRTHYQQNGGYLAYSGGKDSTVLLHLSSRADRNIPVVFFDSGLEFPETIPYVKKMCETLNMELHIIKAEPDALTLLSQTNLWNHDKDYNPEVKNLHEALITEPALKAHSLFGSGELNGLRMGESFGRKMLLSKKGGHYTRKNDIVFSPLWNWQDHEIVSYLKTNKIPLNPVYDKLTKMGIPIHEQRVGLAFDANGLQFGRITWLKRGWPQLYQKIVVELPRIREFQ